MLVHVLFSLPVLLAIGLAVDANQDGFELETLASPASGNCAFPNLARGADGKTYLSWIERGEENFGVMRLSVLEENGWGKPSEVVRGTDLFLNWADFPSVCALKDGTLLAQWLRSGADPHGYSAEFSISSDGGEHWSAPKKLHDDLSSVEHGFVSVAPWNGSDANTFGAIWLDGRASVGKEHGAGETALYFRTISAKGELGPEQVLDSRVCDCCQTSLVAESGGGLVATYRDRSAEEVRDISLVRFDGESWSKPKRVHADEWLIDGCPVNGPRASNANGLSAVAWFTGVGGGGGSVRVAFRKGEWYGAPFDIDEGRPVGRVDLVFLAGDTVLVSWMEYAGEGRADWRVRTVSREGKLGASIKVGEVPSDRASGYLRMVTAGDDVVLTWTTPEPEWQIETARLRARKELPDRD